MKVTPCPPPRNWKELEPHKIATAFPPIDAGEYQDLGASIVRGFDPLHPIVLFDGKILDGRNRIRACVDRNVVPAFARFEGTEEEAARASLMWNLCRRHLTTSQRAAIACELGFWLRSECAAETRTEPTDKEIAKAAGRTPTGREISLRTAQQVMEIKRKDPDQYAKIWKGEVSANRASAIVRAKEESAKPKGPPPRATDQAGVPIPPRARAALTDGRRAFGDILARLQAVRREVSDMATEPLGRRLSVANLHTDIDNLIRQIKDATPYSSCPLGDPCSDKCKLCQGTQWISKLQFDSLPRAMKPKGENNHATSTLSAQSG